MSLTRNDVENIAHLARLALSEEQLPVYVDSLSKIFSFVEQLNGADIATVDQAYQAYIRTITREELAIQRRGS